MPEQVLEVEGLQVSVGDHLVAVQDVSFTIGRGESVGLVGESGSGKTLTCRAVIGLLPATGQVDQGRIVLGAGDDAVELTAARRTTWNAVRGTRLGAVFQDPASYLNPSLTVGHQLAEQLRVKGGLSRGDAKRRAVELFAEVGLHDPESVFHQHPHQLSGGMLQRVLIAISVSCEPELLIADEATTALDVVIQAEILELLRRLRDETGTAIVLITHNMGVVADLADRVAVMYAGEIVETSSVRELFAAPRHDYTKKLLAAVPRLDIVDRALPAGAVEAAPVVAAEGPYAGIGGLQAPERTDDPVPAGEEEAGAEE